MIFHFRLIPVKTNAKDFQKKEKKNNFWHILPILQQKILFKILLLPVVFFLILTMFHCAKKPLKSGFQATLISDERIHVRKRINL